MEKFNEMLSGYMKVAIEKAKNKVVMCNCQPHYECNWCSHNKPHKNCKRPQIPEFCPYGEVFFMLY